MINKKEQQKEEAWLPFNKTEASTILKLIDGHALTKDEEIIVPKMKKEFTRIFDFWTKLELLASKKKEIEKEKFIEEAKKSGVSGVQTQEQKPKVFTGELAKKLIQQKKLKGLK